MKTRAAVRLRRRFTRACKGLDDFFIEQQVRVRMKNAQIQAHADQRRKALTRSIEAEHDEAIAVDERNQDQVVADDDPADEPSDHSGHAGGVAYDNFEFRK